MRKPLVGLGIALAVVAACFLSLVAGALAGGAVAFLAARPAPDVSLPRFWQEEPMPAPRVPEPWEMPPGQVLQPFGWQLNAALISDVDSGDPADEAGVEEGDIILAVGGKAIDERHDLATLIREYQPGDEIVLTVLRRGDPSEIMQVEATLGRDRDEEGEVVPHLGVRYRTVRTGLCFSSLDRVPWD
jgi:membrane-associated protease RseP (regulator of RpoE activity)